MLITQGKTNWKFLLIVVILAVIVGGGILWFSQQQIQNFQLFETEKSNQKIDAVKEVFEIIVPSNYPAPKETRDLFYSFLSYQYYDANHFSELSQFPVISSIDLVSEDSIRRYIDESVSNEIRERRVYLINEFQEQKNALADSKNYGDLKFKKIGNYSYLVSPKTCNGDIYGCTLIKYITFISDTRVEISVGFDQKTTDSAMDDLISQIQIIEKDETADWKTYRNDEYGFEMKYPSEYSIKKYTETNDTYLIMIEFSEYDVIEMPQPYLSVRVYNEPSDINEWLQQNGLGEGWNKNENFFVDGKKAIYLTGGFELEAKPIVIIPYQNKIFRLENYATSYFDQMLSAFRFLD